MAPTLRRGPPRNVKPLDPHFQPPNNLGTKSLLLDLPPELRNEIYERLAQSTTTIVVRNGKAVPDALARSSRRVREEYLGVVASNNFLNVTNIKTTVFNLDFRKLNGFLRKFLVGKDVDGERYCEYRRRQRSRSRRCELLVIHPSDCLRLGDLEISVSFTRPVTDIYPLLVDPGYLAQWFRHCDQDEEMDFFDRHYQVKFDWTRLSITDAEKTIDVIDNAVPGDMWDDDRYDLVRLIRSEIMARNNELEEQRIAKIDACISQMKERVTEGRTASSMQEELDRERKFDEIRQATRVILDRAKPELLDELIEYQQKLRFA